MAILQWIEFLYLLRLENKEFFCFWIEHANFYHRAKFGLNTVTGDKFKSYKR